MKLALLSAAGLLATIFAPTDAAQVHLRQRHEVQTRLTADEDPVDDTDEPSANIKNLEDNVLKMAGNAQSSSVMAEGMDAVSEMIEDTLLPQILNASNASQKEFDDLIAAFDECPSPSFDGGALKGLSDARSPKKTKHDQCRAAEQKAYDEDAECSVVLKLMKTVMESACGAVEALKRDPSDAKAQCNPAPGMAYRDWLGSNNEWFLKEMKDFDALAAKCTEATNTYAAQKPVCDGKASALKSNREECNVEQNHLEDSYCTLESAAVEACMKNIDCYDAATKHYKERRPVIEAEEKARKVNWRVLKRITCLIPILKKGGSAKDIEACKEKTHDTKHLDLNYQEPPEEADCGDAGPMPCGDHFVAAVYSGLPEHAKAAECKICPGGEPASYAQFEASVASAAEICSSDSVFEFTQKWDCGGNDLTSIVSPVMGSGNWEVAFDACAAECANRDDCASFNYPGPGGNGKCWIKHTYRKSQSRDWACGGGSGSWSFFTKIPGRKCKSVPRAREVKWSIPAGVQNNYPLANLPNSWKVFAEQPYKGVISKDSNPGQGDCILWGAKSSAGASTFHVVAFGQRSVIYSAPDRKWENGVFWYIVPNKSIGFADSGGISLNSADTMDGNSEKRLSWHWSCGGWRAGSHKGLNSDSTWRKVVMYGPCSQ